MHHDRAPNRVLFFLCRYDFERFKLFIRKLMRILGDSKVSADGGGCSELERAGQQRRAMGAHCVCEVGVTRCNRESSTAAETRSG